MRSRRPWLSAPAFGAALVMLLSAFVSTAFSASPGFLDDPSYTHPILDPNYQPKFKDALPFPALAQVWYTEGTNINVFHIGAGQADQDLGVVNPNTKQSFKTTIWGYGDLTQPNVQYVTPGPLLWGTSDQTMRVKWENNLPAAAATKHLLPLDTTIMCGDNTVDCAPYDRITVHVHGAHVDWRSDGGPQTWFTHTNGQADPNALGLSQTGPDYQGQLYTYENTQGSTLLWYHDHAMGETRLNVVAGLAGGFILRDSNEQGMIDKGILPSGKYEVPLVIQDRSFYIPDNDPQHIQIAYPDAPIIDPNTHKPVLDKNNQPIPSIAPEYFGTHIMVNGKLWPYLQVEPRKYRFRVLNGCNARFLNLFTNEGVIFNQLGTEGGFLNANTPMRALYLAPAERADIIIDFSKYAGKEIILRNNGKFPATTDPGSLPDPNTDGMVIKFKVNQPLTQPDKPLPISLRTPIKPLTATPGAPHRQLFLDQMMDMYNRMMPMIGTLEDGLQAFLDAPTETPLLGNTEIWTIYNTTVDTHPIHTHLVQFQVLNRQPITYDPTLGPMGNLQNPGSIKLTGAPRPPEANETGWKETVKVYPNESITIIAKFDKPGNYVYHCHILEHEEFDMMRPLIVNTN